MNDKAEANDTSAQGQPVTWFTRGILVVIIVLVFIAGIQLFVFSDLTDFDFAWTINLPLTAAFLGAGYWAALVSSLFSLRERLWVRVRSSLPAAFTSTSLLLIATLLHLDKFHVNRPEFFTWLAAWAWIVVYIVVPPTLIVGFFLQRRVPGINLPRQNKLARWIRILLMVQAVSGIVVGLALFMFPQSLALVWPWALTPLTARAVGAWLAAFGVAAGVIVWENDRSRIKAAIAGLLTFGMLQVIVVIRYWYSIDWSKIGAWLYLLMLISVLAVSAFVLLEHKRKLELA